MPSVSHAHSRAGSSSVACLGQTKQALLLWSVRNLNASESCCEVMAMFVSSQRVENAVKSVAASVCRQAHEKDTTSEKHLDTG